MSTIRLDIQLPPARSESERKVWQAITLLRSGQPQAALAHYRQFLQKPADDAMTCAGLAAFALLAGDPPAAFAHAQRAITLDPHCVPGWINGAVAASHVRLGPQALVWSQRAAELAPDNGTAQFNLAILLQASGERAPALARLTRAAELLPDNWRVQQELARAARSEGQIAQSIALARAALAMQAAGLPAQLRCAPPRVTLDLKAAGQALCDAKAALDAAGIEFFLMAGTLLALVRDGDLLPHDKDIDLGVFEPCDRDRVAAAFAADARFLVPPRPASAEPLLAFGVVHRDSGVAIDLFFAERRSDGVRFGFGLPPTALYCTVRSFGLGQLRWREHDWPVPDDTEQYLRDIYGEHWRTPDRYFDTALSNPSRSPESLPAAIALGLLRLSDALAQQDWPRSLSLCRQLLAREALPDIDALASLLRSRCPELTA